MALTEEQALFLLHDPRKSARVLAGPGTGKSFTSVAYLKKVLDDNPGLRVGYITFTRAATAEFAEKVSDDDLSVVPKTMHGFSLGVLLRHHSSSIPYPLRILDGWETKNIARHDISRMLRAKGYDEATLAMVGKLESEMAAGYQSLDNARLPILESNPSLVNAYKGAWSNHRRRYGYTLLSELPYHAGKVLADIDERDLEVDLLIVDEYQDLNHADQRVLEEIAKRDIAIIAIGDDDQSIYSWRNAAPDGIRNFLDTFSTDQDYPLTVSMRCGGRALEVASDLIEQDSGRVSKPRLTSVEGANDTDFHYIKYASNTTEARGVAEIVAARIAAGVSPSDIAILVRSSIAAWAYNLKSAFARSGIQIGVALEIDKILASPSVRYSIALAQLLQNQDDSIAWRALFKVTPGIGDAFINKVVELDLSQSFATNLMNAYKSNFSSFGVGVSVAKEIINNTLAWLSGTNIDEVVLDDNGWGEWVIQQVGEEKFDENSKIILRAVGVQIGTAEPLNRFLAELEPTAKELASGASEGVRLMTMAQSKGLTVNTAIVLGVEDGNIPSPRALDIDEERRLMYVALTRATHLTVVTYANLRKGPTAWVGNPRVWDQREQSAFMRSLESVSLEDGSSFKL